MIALEDAPHRALGFLVVLLMASLWAALADAADSDAIPLHGIAKAQDSATTSANKAAMQLGAKQNTPEFSATVRQLLNHYYAPSLARSAQAQANLSAQTDAFFSHSAIYGGTPVPPIRPPVAEPKVLTPSAPNLLDADSRYRSNQALLLTSTATNGDRVWGGLPTFRYADTVVIVGNGQLCSGTVIAHNAVLTAQHCYCRGVTDRVLVGNIYDDRQPGNAILPSSRPMKDCGSPGASPADVAVLFTKADFDPSVIPAVFASRSMIDEAKTVRAVGFGLTETNTVGQKMMVDIPVATNDCTGHVQTPTGDPNDSAYYGCNSGFELVAGRPMLNKDTCNGDSGGPIFVTLQGKDYLAGATSRAVTSPTPQANPPTCGDGGIYVRTDGAVLAWLSAKGVQISVAN